MSAATIGISNALDGAFRKACSDAGVRLKPGASISAIIAAFEAMGITSSVDQGLLVLQQGTTFLHPGLSLRTFASKKENEVHFVTSGSHPSTWEPEQKVAYLRTHTADEYGKLLRQPVLEPGIRTLSLDMTSDQYKNLTPEEKVQFVREYGSDGVSRVMRNKASK